jgi:hypothetical protein
MRENIWYSLVDVKFAALYLDECSRFAGVAGQFYSGFLALVASSSVTAWVIWDKHPGVWAVIVGVSQVLHVLRPYVPFFKRGRDYRDISIELESLYLEYERLWYRLAKGKIDSDKAERQLYTLREKELEIDRRSGVQPPRFRWLCAKARTELDNKLQRFF